MSNSSSITQFLLLAFADTRELQLLHFWLFLGIYLAALLGNGLIITAIACDHRLHTPMHFFLLNLSALDLGSLSTTFPKAMANSLWDTRDISYSGCAAQLFLFVFLFGLLMSAEYCLLTIMAYDRYVAICKPLHYGTLLGSRACVHMAAAAWGYGFLSTVLHTASTFSLPLCQGNVLDQFFCEIPQILKLSCSHSYLREVGLLVITAFFVFGCFVFIVVSYVQIFRAIFRAVLRIPSEQGRHKAFSTCLPHLAVVSLFVSTAVFAYLKPPSISSPLLDMVVTVLYSVVPPALNPFIYSMRNHELKDAVRNLISWIFGNRCSGVGPFGYNFTPVSAPRPPYSPYAHSMASMAPIGLRYKPYAPYRFPRPINPGDLPGRGLVHVNEPSGPPYTPSMMAISAPIAPMAPIGPPYSPYAHSMASMAPIGPPYTPSMMAISAPMAHIGPPYSPYAHSMASMAPLGPPYTPYGPYRSPI
ncbi:PREDICTED: olfactory receptor 14A16-like [Calidris pugnax]|uniref:olfactory receptor 14A16-like n=1 Tax=Calidris pugnax TaxID=198806 RepID=UPI00071C83B1|nr:PREDICTED: olfactory receptor 14A16-like [Calidris pugnax]